MKNVYPVVLIPDKEGYVVNVPDFDIMTQGDSLSDAIDMARDAISLMGVQYQDDNKPLPDASKVSSVAHEEDEIVTLVDVDFASYRKMLENRSIRKNCKHQFLRCSASCPDRKIGTAILKHFPPDLSGGIFYQILSIPCRISPYRCTMTGACFSPVTSK